MVPRSARPRPFDRIRRRLAHADDGWLFASIASQVTERRLALGLSQVELARLCATSQSAIARLENGGRPPRIDTLLRLAEALDCDLAVELRLGTPHWPRREDVMDVANEVLARIDEIDGELRELSAELRELRGLVTQTAVAPAPEATQPARRARFDEPVASGPPASPAARLEAAIVPRGSISRRATDAALDELERRDRVLARRSGALHRLEIVLDGIARYQPPCARGPARSQRPRGSPRSRPTRSRSERPSLPPRRAARQSRRASHRRPGRSALDPAEACPDRAGRPRSSPRDWDLLGPRGFAIVGGAVTALGVILLFVLAANRGWITPGDARSLRRLVSALAVGAGFAIRHRYGQLQASLGAVGAGIAGGYASLAAATARYDLVPDWLALPLAGCLAALAVVIAIALGVRDRRRDRPARARRSRPDCRRSTRSSRGPPPRSR